MRLQFEHLANTEEIDKSLNSQSRFFRHKRKNQEEKFSYSTFALPTSLPEVVSNTQHKMRYIDRQVKDE